MARLVSAGLRDFFFPAHGVLRPRPFAVVALISAMLATAVALTPPAQVVEWRVYDLYSRLMVRDPQPAPDVVVVAIDEPSFTEVGLPWPWPRALHGALVDRLKAGGARTIAFDVIFDVPSGSAEDDDSFAESMKNAGNVILGSDQAAIEDRNYALTQWSEPTPLLLAAAAGTGVVRIPYDEDAVLRRTDLVVEGRPTLAHAVAARHRGFAAPRTDTGARLFRYNGPSRRGIVTVSYYQALDAERSLPRDIFRDKHVLVGRSLAATSIDESTDHFHTPVDIRMPGVEIHATVVDALLRDRFIADPFGAAGRVVLLCLLLGLATGFVVYRFGATTAPAVAVGGALACAIAGYVALVNGVRLVSITPIVTIAGTYAATAAYRYSLSNRERRLIKRAFQNYVAPAIVDRMLADPSRLKLGGEEYEVTVLFSDLEGFTSLSERVSPTELSAHLGGYFKAMLDVLLPQGGTLDKLIGDAVMMYFGAPVPDEAHASQACRGALLMQQRMIDLNAAWAAEGLPQLRTRIGINTGRAVAGNMGTDTIFNYTILGDCVNLASRLEGVNKEYGTLIIIGEDTWERVHDAFEFRELDWIRVKGKAQPVAIYELAGELGSVSPERRAVFATYAEGLTQYRQGEWIAAARAFSAALALDPHDGPSAVMAARVAHYAAHLPQAWDGVHVMSFK